MKFNNDSIFLITFKVEYNPSLLEPLVKAKFELFSLDNKPMSDKPSERDQRNLDNKIKVSKTGLDFLFKNDVSLF